MDNIEELLAEYSGKNKAYWEEYRKSQLNKNDTESIRALEHDSPNEDEDDPPDYFLEEMEEDEGLIDLPTLYRMALALEDSKEGQKVTLDLRGFIYYYKEDNENPEKILSDVKGRFLGKVDIYNYLLAHLIGINDRKKMVLDRLRLFSEDQIIDQILVPSLHKLGFHNIERVPHHGPRELGLDIRPFYEVDKFNKRFYYGAQVKAINIHNNSRKEGNVHDIVRQLSDALGAQFTDKEDNEKKRIDRVMLVTSQRVNDSAKEVLRNEFPNRALVIIEGNELAEYIMRFGLANRVLQSNIPHRHPRKNT